MSIATALTPANSSVRELAVVALQTLLRPVLHDILHRALLDIADQSLVRCRFANAFSSTPMYCGIRRSLRASPRSTALCTIPQASSQLVPVKRVTPVTSHSFKVSISQLSHRKVNCEPGHAQGAGTCRTPCSGHLTRTNRACRYVWQWHVFRCRHTRSCA